MGSVTRLPMHYYDSMLVIRDLLPSNTILINEGSNTMDIGRQVFNHDEPKKRLDAGTFGTMGIGIPFCIAAKLVNKMDGPLIAPFFDFLPFPLFFDPSAFF